MPGSLLQYLQDHGFVLLSFCAVAGLIWRMCHLRSRRLRRIRERDRLAREVEDALVQNAQGLILNVHGLVKNLAADDPLRQRAEQVLDRADEQLSGERDRVQDLRTQAKLDGEPSCRSKSHASQGAVPMADVPGKAARRVVRLARWLGWKPR